VMRCERVDRGDTWRKRTISGRRGKREIMDLTPFSERLTWRERDTWQVVSG
jgi:hypothetical protein